MPVVKTRFRLIGIRLATSSMTARMKPTPSTWYITDVPQQVPALILRVAAAVEVDDDRQRLRAGARWHMNDVGALAEVDAVVARREGGEEEERTQHGQRRAVRNSSA